MIDVPVNRICEHCRPFIDAFVGYSQELDDPLQLVANLCVSVVSDSGSNDIGEIGTFINDHLEKQNILKNFFFDAELRELKDNALIKSERVKIAERFREDIL